VRKAVNQFTATIKIVANKHLSDMEMSRPHLHQANGWITASIISNNSNHAQWLTYMLGLGNGVVPVNWFIETGEPRRH
jgi:hypothetical protein